MLLFFFNEWEMHFIVISSLNELKCIQQTCRRIHCHTVENWSKFWCQKSPQINLSIRFGLSWHTHIATRMKNHTCIHKHKHTHTQILTLFRWLYCHQFSTRAFINVTVTGAVVIWIDIQWNAFNCSNIHFQIGTQFYHPV